MDRWLGWLLSLTPLTPLTPVLLPVLVQMSSRCRNVLNVVVTSLFAALVLLTILLAYVTGTSHPLSWPDEPVSRPALVHPGLCWT